jgi:hypothetical protein
MILNLDCGSKITISLLSSDGFVHFRNKSWKPECVLSFNMAGGY